jgi:uroporphyrinogen-III decarboxylase
MSDGEANAHGPGTVDLFEGWERLNWHERRERRFARWLAPQDLQFADEGARVAYRQRVQMAIDAICLRKPARVPVAPSTGGFAGRHAGLTAKEMMYDHHKMAAAIVKYHEGFRPDFQGGIATAGRVFDLLGARYVRWPGHGVGDDSPWQYIEGEYMRAEEYDALIADPETYFRRTLLPRHASAFEPLAKLDPFSDYLEAFSLPMNILAFADPDVIEGLHKLTEAAQASLEQLDIVGAAYEDAAARLGIPELGAGFAVAPYDVLADTLRGTRGIVSDLYRRRGKVIEAAERLVPLQIEMAVRQMTDATCPVVFMPLHKGADGFMSDEDFCGLYWPTLKAVLKGIIDEGLVPNPFAEGGFNSRLRAIADDALPSGSCLWMFDQTDMAAAKDVLGGYACIMGNVPSDLLAVGSAKQVEDYVTRLLDTVASDGGFILSSGAIIDDAKAENLKAMIETGRNWRG